MVVDFAVKSASAIMSRANSEKTYPRRTFTNLSMMASWPLRPVRSLSKLIAGVMVILPHRCICRFIPLAGPHRQVTREENVDSGRQRRQAAGNRHINFHNEGLGSKRAAHKPSHLIFLSSHDGDFGMQAREPPSRVQEGYERFTGVKGSVPSVKLRFLAVYSST